MYVDLISNMVFISGTVIFASHIFDILSDFALRKHALKDLERFNYLKRHSVNNLIFPLNIFELTIETIDGSYTKFKSSLREIADWGKAPIVMVGSGAIFLIFSMFSYWAFNSAIISSVASLSISTIYIFATVRYFQNRRRDLILRDMPQTIDGIIRCLRSGFDLSRSLSIVASEAPTELRIELQYILQSRDFGLSLGDALYRMAERLESEDLVYLATLISAQERSGGPLVNALDSLSQILKDRETLRQKRMNATAEARTSALILGGLPVIVAFVLLTINPNYRDVLLSTRAGHLFLFAAVILLGIGSFIMYRMVRLEAR